MPRSAQEQEPARLDGLADRLVRVLLEVGIDGMGRFESAASLAERTVAEASSRTEAIGRLVTLHTRLAAAGGFATGLGGFVTLPVALPANVASFYVLATRMVAATASVRGYDVRRDEVRTAVLLTLTGHDARDVLRKAGVAFGPGRLTSMALSRLSGPTLMVVNKAVGFRLLVRLGQRGLTRLGRGVPLAGGVIGAGLDALLLRGIAREAERTFPPQAVDAGPRQVTA